MCSSDLFISFGSTPEISDDLIIRSELKSEPPKQIQITKSKPQKQPNQSDSRVLDSESMNLGPQGGALNQTGIPFKLPESGTLFYDSFVDGQKLQTGEIDWIVSGSSYRLYINIPYAFVGPFVFESRGTVDAYGIAPAIYWSQRGTRAPR